MYSCCLCQKQNKNLTNIYNSRLRSLTQIILKLKGYKDSLDLNAPLMICKECQQGIKKVSSFWEHIPEANQEPVIKNIDRHSDDIFNSKHCLPAITSCQDSYQSVSTKKESTHEPLNIRIKLPHKQKKKIFNTINNSSLDQTNTTTETLTKREIRLPKRYEDFSMNSTNKTSAPIQALDQTSMSNDITLEVYHEMALIRLNNGQNIAKLVEVDSKGDSSRMKIICQICWQVFRFEKAFKKHLTNHTNFTLDLVENYLFFCKQCDKSYREHYAVRRHYKYVHSQKRLLKCQHCEASFKYKFNLDYHMAKHFPKKGFECAFCKKLFIMRYEMNIHLRTHTKERPYKCQYCSYACAHLSNLKTHQKVKHFKDSKNVSTVKDLTAVRYESMKENLVCTEVKLNEELVKEAATKNLSNDLKTESNEMYCIKSADSTENIASKADHINNNNNKFLEKLEAFNTPMKSTNNITERFSFLPENATVHIDNNILRMFPTTGLLDLKKWPKYFQTTASDNQEHNSNFLNESKNSTFLETAVSDSHEVNNYNKNLAEITNINDSSNISHITPSSTYSEFSTSESSSKVSAANAVSILTNDSKYSNISKSTSSVSDFRYFNGSNQLKVIDNSLARYEKSNNCNSEIVMEIQNLNSNVNNNLLSSTEQIQNINNFKRSELHQSDIISSSDYSNSTKADAENKKISQEYKDAKSSKIIKYSAYSSNTGKLSLKSPTNSAQSLLKPDWKSSIISTIANTDKATSQLPNKPLITNIEILPNLNLLHNLHEPFSNTSRATLIKPPASYKYQCIYCLKYFKQKSPLTKHIRTHTSEKPYKCKLCPKSYADPSNYKRHKILHKNAAEALNITYNKGYAVQNSPAYSTISDPDPDGIEMMQTLIEFESFPMEEDSVDDDSSLSSLTIESNMWQEALEHALENEEIRGNIKRNLTGLNNAIMPKSMKQLAIKSHDKIPSLNTKLSSEDPD